MSKETIKQILMRRDGLTAEEADNAIQAAVNEMNEYLAFGDVESAYEICSEHFGFEPDYLMELI